MVWEVYMAEYCRCFICGCGFTLDPEEDTPVNLVDFDWLCKAQAIGICDFKDGSYKFEFCSSGKICLSEVGEMTSVRGWPLMLIDPVCLLLRYRMGQSPFYVAHPACLQIVSRYIDSDGGRACSRYSLATWDSFFYLIRDQENEGYLLRHSHLVRRDTPTYLPVSDPYAIDYGHGYFGAEHGWPIAQSSINDGERKEGCDMFRWLATNPTTVPGLTEWVLTKLMPAECPLKTFPTEHEFSEDLLDEGDGIFQYLMTAGYRSPFERLPSEIMLHVQKCLDPVSVIRLSRCNKYLYNSINSDQSTWRELLCKGLVPYLWDLDVASIRATDKKKTSNGSQWDWRGLTKLLMAFEPHVWSLGESLRTYDGDMPFYYPEYTAYRLTQTISDDDEKPSYGIPPGLSNRTRVLALIKELLLRHSIPLGLIKENRHTGLYGDKFHADREFHFYSYVKDVIQKGKDPSSMTIAGHPILLAAANMGYSALLKLLLDGDSESFFSRHVKSMDERWFQHFRPLLQHTLRQEIVDSLDATFSLSDDRPGLFSICIANLIESCSERASPVSTRNLTERFLLGLIDSGYEDLVNIVLGHIFKNKISKKRFFYLIENDAFRILHTAVFAGRMKVVRALLSYGWKLTTNELYNPLETAIDADQYKILEIFIEEDRDLVLQSAKGALWYACKRGKLKTIQWLLSRGATPKDWQIKQLATLFPRYKENSEKIFLLMFAYSANVEGKDENGDGVLVAAAKTGNLKLFELVRDLKVISAKDATQGLYHIFDSQIPKNLYVEGLLACGANINDCSNPNGSPLTFAMEIDWSWYGLIKYGANLNLHVKNIGTPMQVAFDLNKPRDVLLLLDRGASPWGLTNDGKLYWAKASEMRHTASDTNTEMNWEDAMIALEYCGVAFLELKELTDEQRGWVHKGTPKCYPNSVVAARASLRDSAGMVTPHAIDEDSSSELSAYEDSQSDIDEMDETDG